MSSHHSGVTVIIIDLCSCHITLCLVYKLLILFVIVCNDPLQVIFKECSDYFHHSKVLLFKSSPIQ